MVRMPELRDMMDEDHHPHEGYGDEIDELTRSVPRLIATLADAQRDSPDIRHKAALAEMIIGLSMRLDKMRPSAVSPGLTIRFTAVSYSGRSAIP